jgi:hypothetical protein
MYGQEHEGQSDSVEGIMGAPVRESNDSEPLKSELSKSETPKNQPLKDALKDVGPMPSSRRVEAPKPPSKRRMRHGVFKGDVAIVELRSRLTLAPERIPEPVAPVSTVPTFVAALRVLVGLLLTATAAGVAGYLWGVSPLTKSPELAPASDQAKVLPALSSLAANLKTSSRDSEPSVSRTAVVGLAPVDARGPANDVTTVDESQSPVSLAAVPRTILMSPASRPPAPADDASEIAAKMKIGAELMAHGDITAARMMFERAAEAGEAAGAFALAETYDPMVLKKLPLRGGIAPNLALARSWYEKAKDLGSITAPERIARLTQVSR